MVHEPGGPSGLGGVVEHLVGERVGLIVAASEGLQVSLVEAALEGQVDPILAELQLVRVQREIFGWLEHQEVDVGVTAEVSIAYARVEVDLVPQGFYEAQKLVDLVVGAVFLGLSAVVFGQSKDERAEQYRWNKCDTLFGYHVARATDE